MILGLSGLHGSGKSHLSTRIAFEYGWKACVKRDLLKQLYSCEGTGDDWVAWYRTLYASQGAYEVTRKLLGLLPKDDRLILDSVHNLGEWRAIRNMHPDAVLASVIAPKSVRAARNGPEVPGLDVQRVRFWHEAGDHASCLAVETEWCFNGAASDEIQKIEFESFLAHYAIG